jgi:3-isopropylmalate/(R)-2-methylmalate dehydratase large subunit
MGMTAIEKIMARKAGRQNVSAGETVVVEVDMTVLVDLQFAMMWYPPIRIHDPDKIAIVMDHAVPAPTIKDAEGGSRARKFAADFGIKRRSSRRQPRHCHPVIADNGLARLRSSGPPIPTPAQPVPNNAAQRSKPAEIYSIMRTGTTCIR